MIQIHINTYIYVYIFVFFKRAEIESIFKEYDTNKDGVSGEKLLYLLRSIYYYVIAITKIWKCQRNLLIFI